MGRNGDRSSVKKTTADRNRSALRIISRSYLLQTQARHVYLHWPARGRGRVRQQEQLLNEQWAFECLSRFRNPRSLDVHVDNGSARVMTDDYWKQHMHMLDDYYDSRTFYDDERREELIARLKTHRRKLEKAVVRTDISDPKIIKLMDEHKTFEWWRRLKRDVAVLASRGPSSVEREKEDPYVFKQHIGGLKLCWPRASTV